MGGYKTLLNFLGAGAPVLSISYFCTRAETCELIGEVILPDSDEFNEEWKRLEEVLVDETYLRREVRETEELKKLKSELKERKERLDGSKIRDWCSKQYRIGSEILTSSVNTEDSHKRLVRLTCTLTFRQKIGKDKIMNTSESWVGIGRNVDSEYTKHLDSIKKEPQLKDVIKDIKELSKWCGSMYLKTYTKKNMNLWELTKKFCSWENKNEKKKQVAFS